MKFLITGGCGFLGSNLAEKVLRDKNQLVVFDNLFRNGSEQNLNWLKSLGEFKYYSSDIRNFDDVEYCIKTEKPDVIFHVAGQVAMTTSLARPRLDFEINALGTHNILEAMRTHIPNAKIIYSSTNKVYGDLEDLEYQENQSRYTIPAFPNGLPESTPLDFRTPYGCSKGSADQYMLDYAKCFNLNTTVFRHSSIYGGRQFSSFDQGWIGWFVKQAIETKNNKLDSPFTIAGNGKQVRDVLFASDLVDCYFLAMKNPKTRGQAFNIGGGIDNSLSLLELFEMLEKKLQTKLNYKKLPPRESDQKYFVADIKKAHEVFNWKPKISKDEGISKMIDWVLNIG